MNLPDHSVGITDLLAYRECPRRFAYGMRRHVGRAEQNQSAMMPEASVMGAAWARSYGSAFHDVAQLVEDGASDDEALGTAFARYGFALTPDDLPALRADLAVYRERDFAGTRIVALEDEYRVPLLVHDNEQIYFRFKIDRIDELLSAPGRWIHRDYKTSRHAKSASEVNKDLQMWSYNFGIHEVFPECEDLLQVYDQLRFGQLTTRKTAQQRNEIRAWLVEQTTAVLQDESLQDDGLLEPRYNEWCAYCPIMESCAVVGQLTDFALTRIAELAPQRPKLKSDGTPGKRMESVPLEASRLPEYADVLDKVMIARGVLKRFDESVRDLVRDLPDQRRGQLGFELRSRRNSNFTPQAAKALHDGLGERFYELVTVGKTRLEEALGEDPDALNWALGLAVEEEGTPAVFRKGST